MAELATIFAAVFVAEFGDKTQIATLLFASNRALNPLAVFGAAAAALVVSTAAAVFLGNTGARFLDLLPIKLIAGLGFVGIGIWSIADHFRGP